MANEVESSLSCFQQEPGINLMVPPWGTALFRNEMGSCPSTKAQPLVFEWPYGGVPLSQQNQYGWLGIIGDPVITKRTGTGQDRNWNRIQNRPGQELKQDLEQDSFPCIQKGFPQQCTKIHVRGMIMMEGITHYKLNNQPVIV